ncbi:hypothetical protein TKK_0015373 [Trichogramma kaykai]
MSVTVYYAQVKYLKDKKLDVLATNKIKELKENPPQSINDFCKKTVYTGFVDDVFEGCLELGVQIAFMAETLEEVNKITNAGRPKFSKLDYSTIQRYYDKQRKKDTSSDSIEQEEDASNSDQTEEDGNEECVRQVKLQNKITKKRIAEEEKKAQQTVLAKRMRTFTSDKSDLVIDYGSSQYNPRKENTLDTPEEDDNSIREVLSSSRSTPHKVMSKCANNQRKTKNDVFAKTIVSQSNYKSDVAKNKSNRSIITKNKYPALGIERIDDNNIYTDESTDESTLQFQMERTSDNDKIKEQLQLLEKKYKKVATSYKYLKQQNTDLMNQMHNFNNTNGSFRAEVDVYTDKIVATPRRTLVESPRISPSGTPMRKKTSVTKLNLYRTEDEEGDTLHPISPFNGSAIGFKNASTPTRNHEKKELPILKQFKMKVNNEKVHMIHLGYGHNITYDEWLEVMAAPTDSLCVKYLLRILYRHEQLICRSVAGDPKSEKSSPKIEQKSSRFVLDSSQIRARFSGSISRCSKTYKDIKFNSRGRAIIRPKRLRSTTEEDETNCKKPKQKKNLVDSMAAYFMNNCPTVNESIDKENDSMEMNKTNVKHQNSLNHKQTFVNDLDSFSNNRKNDVNDGFDKEDEEYEEEEESDEDEEYDESEEDVERQRFEETYMRENLDLGYKNQTESYATRKNDDIYGDATGDNILNVIRKEMGSMIHGVESNIFKKLDAIQKSIQEINHFEPTEPVGLSSPEGFPIKTMEDFKIISADANKLKAMKSYLKVWGGNNLEDAVKHYVKECLTDELSTEWNWIKTKAEEDEENEKKNQFYAAHEKFNCSHSDFNKAIQDGLRLAKQRHRDSKNRSKKGSSKKKVHFNKWKNTSVLRVPMIKILINATTIF